VIPYRFHHQVDRPHERRDLVSPGGGPRIVPRIFPDHLPGFFLQIVQRLDERDRKGGADRCDPEEDDQPPLGHLHPVLAEQFLYDADVRLDDETEFLIDDDQRDIGIGPEILAVREEHGL
jgi:hypothetical protein